VSSEDPIDDHRRLSFESRAEQYDEVRPGYPDALIDELFALSGIPAGGRILEVGAGTGKATVALARRGHTVIAIEPGPNMAAVLRRNVDGYGVDIAETTFEEWSGPAVHLVVSAQAFHWVRPDVRYTRSRAVLEPGGALALLRNDRGELDPALGDGLDRAYAAHFPLSPPPTVDEAVRQIAAEIDDSGCFGPVEVRLHPWTATYSTADYVRLIDTSSDHITLEESRRRRLYDEIAALIDALGGRVEIPYVATLHLARVRAG
jgi:SAM-dependent methyltransferase